MDNRAWFDRQHAVGVSIPVAELRKKKYPRLCWLCEYRGFWWYVNTSVKYLYILNFDNLTAVSINFGIYPSFLFLSTMNIACCNGGQNRSINSVTKAAMIQKY